MTILLTTLTITAVFWKLFAARKDVISHLSIATAYPALLLTARATRFARGLGKAELVPLKSRDWQGTAAS